jgi:hypothetical protein
MRRAFRLPGYLTLADVDMDGDYVSPMQMKSHSPTGPVLLAFNWADAATVRKKYPILREHGYLPAILFNKVVDAALKNCNMSRSGVYITQAFHLLRPEGMSGSLPAKCMNASFQAVTRHELVGRRVIALGIDAATTCQRNGVLPDRVVDHPSARGPGRTIAAKAAELAAAIKATLK